ncbi:ATP-dependent DNA helicase [Bacteroides ovatus]|jgi:ATP-dependent exoDNAse (exonuclease V) alpha subunit|uniref:ATP-dependent DNA helicase n=1 Tax=Bacteroides ovatus TaxID=28116 RepID=UPI00189AD625|nr:AAA family ATPase [Bacteroides ovatus]MDC2621682.1 AAA family ATPase [Bacteroides ovatus]MDC2635739.1 AAA family ATPase [Bacteroides ovatus]MDC2652519.1 AAA family ATPase [Bacteroides ovatus]
MAANKKITLKDGQQRAFELLQDFIRNKDKKVFILKGYAGTGKTTMMKVLIEELKRRNLYFSLLASTGRAAKILSNTTGQQAATVHGTIYKYNDLNQNLEELIQQREAKGVDSSGQLLLNFELNPVSHTNRTEEWYYIVDEASMISDKEDATAVQASFGSGRLLKDLLDYDSKGKFLFVGDACQLPPISQKVSPALSLQYFKDVFSILASEVELTEIVRQDKGNDIVLSSQKIRRLYANPQPWKWAKFPFRGCKNIHIVNSQVELIQLYIQRIKKKGLNNSTLLCYSNRQCDTITQIVRPSLNINSAELAIGDLLLVTQNNYVSGLMNGDLVVVESVTHKEVRAGLTFLNVMVKELFTEKSYSQLMIADILYQNQINLSQIQQKELFIDFYKRMKQRGIRQGKDEFNRQMMKDPYLNALRAVFGYALTCHKAQGGEWEYVFLDIPRSVPCIEKPYVYQWIYTAMTRAKQELYIVDDFWVI